MRSGRRVAVCLQKFFHPWKCGNTHRFRWSPLHWYSRGDTGILFSGARWTTCYRVPRSAVQHLKKPDKLLNINWLQRVLRSNPVNDVGIWTEKKDHESGKEAVKVHGLIFLTEFLHLIGIPASAQWKCSYLCLRVLLIYLVDPCKKYGNSLEACKRAGSVWLRWKNHTYWIRQPWTGFWWNHRTRITHLQDAISTMCWLTKPSMVQKQSRIKCRDTHRDHAFCSCRGQDGNGCSGCHKDVRFHDNPLVVGKPDIRFAGITAGNAMTRI